MRFLLRTITVFCLLALGIAGGFLAATDYRPQFDELMAKISVIAAPVMAKAGPQILYFRNLIGLADASPGPKKETAATGRVPAPAEEAAMAKAEKKILYYRNPMGLADTSPGPKKDSMGMDYIPVFEEEAAMAKADKKILYYRNPMGLADTSPEPKKDSMGMDYIPVYEDEGGASADPNTVRVSVEKIQRAGVVSEVVEKRQLADAIHVPGTVQLDERRERSITMRSEGFIEKVYAGSTGQTVKAGEPLFRIYSPQIVQAVVDYRIAVAQGAKAGGARKLLNLGIPNAIIDAMPAKGDIPLSLDWPSPVDGVLMKKNIVVGARVMPGDEIYRLADVSTVWVMADVPEQDIGRVKRGDAAEIAVRAFPGEKFMGKVAFILPELKAETRTAQVRIELPNPGHKLLHQMFADVSIASGGNDPVLAIPVSAVIDSGLRKVAIADLGEGRFAPRAIETGRAGDGYVEVLKGLSEGDRVVTRANFLLDAESNLKSALTALSSGAGQQP